MCVEHLDALHNARAYGKKGKNDNRSPCPRQKAPESKTCDCCKEVDAAGICVPTSGTEPLSHKSSDATLRCHEMLLLPGVSVQKQSHKTTEAQQHKDKGGQRD